MNILAVIEPKRVAPDLNRPSCSNCGTEMWLTRIEPYFPGQHKQTFECPVCDASETMLVDSKTHFVKGTSASAGMDG